MGCARLQRRFNIRFCAKENVSPRGAYASRIKSGMQSPVYPVLRTQPGVYFLKLRHNNFSLKMMTFVI